MRRGSWLLLCLMAAAPLRAQAPTVSWSPAAPSQGTLFTIELTATPTSGQAAGQFAGEPLHFRDLGGGRRSALAAVPVDAPRELPLELTVAGEPLRRTIPIGAGKYRLEHLTVAPQFGSPLPPALQRRTEQETARAYAVASAAHASEPMWTPGEFVRPRPGRVTSGFGNGREFNGQVDSRHMGTDFSGSVGDPVVAPAPGVVELVASFYLGGNVIYIDHGGGLSTGYLHLSRADVAVGDTVAAGQRIGAVGATGRVTGPHLHWIVRYGAITVDPLSVFDLPRP